MAITAPVDQVLQHWRGHVISVGPDTFWAALSVVTGEGPDLYAEIYTRELSAMDQTDLVPNHVLEWKIGYRRDAKGTCRKFSEIRLVRVGPWTAEDLQVSEADLAEVAALFETDTP